MLNFASRQNEISFILLVSCRNQASFCLDASKEVSRFCPAVYSVSGRVGGWVDVGADDDFLCLLVRVRVRERVRSLRGYRSQDVDCL